MFRRAQEGSLAGALLGLGVVAGASDAQALYTTCTNNGVVDFDVNGGKYCAYNPLRTNAGYNVECSSDNSSGSPVNFGLVGVSQVAVDPTGRPFAVRGSNLYTIVDDIEKLVSSVPSCISDRALSLAVFFVGKSTF